MSNFLAPATVTATLVELLRRATSAAVAGAQVTAVPPSARGDRAGPPRVNVFLYQVAFNGDLRNQELPVRRPDGSGASRPFVPVDLRYLISFYGDETALEPQRLLGATVAALHATPVPTRELVAEVVVAATRSDPNHPLASSDLAEQPIPVRLTPVVLSIEEHARMWSNLFQIPYVLSIPYIAAVALLESKIAVTPAPPATRVGMAVGPTEPLRVTEVSFEGEELALPRGAVVLRGQFGSAALSAAIDGQRVSLSRDGDALRLRLPADRVGPRTLTLTRADRATCAVSLLVHPRLRAVALSEDATRLIATIEPPGEGPVGLVLLPTFEGGVPQTLRSADGAEFPIAGVPPGRYLARAQVGALLSPLRLGSGGRPTGPAVRIP